MEPTTVSQASGPGLLFVLVPALYLLALLGVGAYKARRVHTQEDFSLAGRGLPTFVLVGTLLATWIGTGSIFGNAEETYRVGLPAFLIPLSGALGIVLLYLLAARIRRFGGFTIQDILEARFGPAARVIGTITLLLAYVIIVSYQYRAGAAVIGRIVPGIEPQWAIAFVALFVILYTALAGMYSVAYTDVANGVLMVLGIGLAIPVLLAQAGGLAQALDSLPSGKEHVFGHYSTVELLSILLPALLLLLGDANMYQRFFSARTAGDARRSAGWMLVGVVLLECGIIAVACLGLVLVEQGKLAAPENAGHIVVQLAFQALGPVLGALMIGTVIAVIVSTADSYLLAPSTSLVRDVYLRFVSPQAPPRRVVLVGRVVVVLLGVVALGLAFASDEFFSVALFAYTIYGAGITPALLAAFFWPRATSAGAVASMLTGVATSLVWKGLTTASIRDALDVGWLGELGAWAAEQNVDAVLPAVAVSTAVLVVVSLAGPRPPAEKARAI